MQKGTVTQAIALAKTRWAQQFPFDLDEQTWVDIFSRHSQPGEVLEAVKLMKGTVDPRPERVFERFQRVLDKVSARYEPRDIQN